MPCSLIVLDDVEDLLDEDRRQAHRRLVEEEDLGLGHQRAADREHLLLAARQRPGLLRLAFLEAREQAVDPLEVGLRRPPCRLREKAPISRFSWTDIRLKTRRPSGDWQTPELDDLVRPALVDPLAAQRDLALARPGAARRSSAAWWTCRRRSSR